MNDLRTFFTAFVSMATLFSCSVNNKEEKNDIIFKARCENQKDTNLRITGVWYIDSMFVDGLYVYDTVSYKKRGFVFNQDLSFGETRKLSQSGHSSSIIGHWNKDNYNIMDNKSETILYTLECCNDSMITLMSKHKTHIYICRKDKIIEEMNRAVLGPNFK